MRTAARAVGGFYATPAHLTARIAALVTVAWRGCAAWQRLAVVDPCAADGSAVFAALRAWAPPPETKHGGVRLYAAEMERGRARTLADRAVLLHGRDAHVHTGDGLRIDTGTPNGCEGASVLWLNPPYDDDRTCGRLEERFLRAWVPRLAVGGALVFLVPHYALAASAETLGRHFRHLTAFRFPGADFDAFKQVVVVGEKATELTHPAPAVKMQCALWAESAAALPELPMTPGAIVRVAPGAHGFELWQERAARVDVLRATHAPWATTTRTGDLAPVEGILPAPAANLLRAEFPTAMPPRPSHIAAALAAGVYSGAEVEPDDAASGLPRAQIKATFDREWVPREEKRNPKGDVVGVLEVQAPRMCITALDLDAFTYHELTMEAEATGSTSLASFTAGDLLARYGRSLLGTLRDRCPVLHDPQRDGGLDVPLARPLYRAQAHAAATGVKLLDADDGTHPLLLGEVGTGKTGSFLAMAVARWRRRPATARALSVLVMCPPHLLTSWQNQCRAVLGSVVPHEVTVLDSLDDVERYAAWRASPASRGRMGVAILSREKAKLGHAWVSVVTPHCPACGAHLGPEKSAGERARRRLRCKALTRAPANRYAPIAEALAAALAPRWGTHADVADLLPPRRVAALTARALARTKDDAAGRSYLAQIDPTRTGDRSALAQAVADAAGAVFDLFGSPGAAIPHDEEPVLRAFVLGLVAALGSGAVALDVAARYHTLPRPDGAQDYHGNNRRSHAAELALGLCLLVRDPDLRDRRDDLVRTILATLTATDGRRAAWGEKDSALAGRSTMHHGNDYWYTLERSAGGGIVYAAREKRRALGTLDALPEILGEFAALAAWTKPNPCGTPLYQAESTTDGGLRRVPLATYLARRHRGLFDLMAADEAHELSSESSAQGRASTRLMASVREVVHLTGSSSNGYASSLFTMLYNASPRFRREFKRDHEGLFVTRYGLRKRLVQQVDKEGRVVAFGAHTDRVETKYVDKGEAPGVLPLLVLRHVLPLAVTIQKADLALDLAPHEERVVLVAPGDALAAQHGRLVARVVERVKKDAFTPLTGKLWGALARLPSQADRATDDTGNWTGEGMAPAPLDVEHAGIPGGEVPKGAYVVAYPESAGPYAHRPVAIAAPFPAAQVMPKEAEMLRIIAEELAEGRRVMLLAWHANVLPRLKQLVEKHLGEACALLDAEKVTPAKREAWIDREVIGKGRRVMVVNPVAVQTGLNNLVWFSTQVWVENPGCNPVVYDQASGRIDRIGKTLPTRAIFLVYDLPTQRALHRLLMHKAGVLRGVDGLSPEHALEAAGATGDLAFAGLGLGRELYAMLTGEA